MPKIVFWDIETTPLLAWVWGRKPDYIPHDNIEQSWRIICASWMTDDSNRVHTAVGDNGCDKNIILALYEMFGQADVLVHHNGDRFDYRRVVTRGSAHGLKPPPKPKTIDTLKQARKHFDLPSNKLGDIAEYFGLPGKQQVGMKDFIACAKGDEEAIKKLVKYNRQDVKVQKEIYNKLKPYIDTPNVTLYHNLPDGCCPKCGGADVKQRGRTFNATAAYKRYVCQSCGAWFRGKHAVKTAELR